MWIIDALIEAKRDESHVVFTENLRAKRAAIAPARERGRPKAGDTNNVGNTNNMPSSLNGSEYAVARLKRDRPDLAEKVATGELDLNALKCSPGGHLDRGEAEEVYGIIDLIGTRKTTVRSGGAAADEVADRIQADLLCQSVSLGQKLLVAAESLDEERQYLGRPLQEIQTHHQKLSDEL